MKATLEPDFVLRIEVKQMLQCTAVRGRGLGFGRRSDSFNSRRSLSIARISPGIWWHPANTHSSCQTSIKDLSVLGISLNRRN